MRIAVDYSVLSTEAANRGMGRYTQQQLREVLHIDHENEYLLLCNNGAKKNLIFPEIKAAPNVRVVDLPLTTFTKWRDLEQPENVLRYAAEFQEFLYRQQVDLYHATAPFLGNATPHFDVCPMVATLYDLIPFVYPREYLPPGSVTRELYARALPFLLDASRLIAISQSAQRDVHLYLGYPSEQVDLAYPIIEPCFRTLAQAEVEAALRKLRRRLDVPGDFILSVTGIHHSKNARTLLEAYSRLSPALRDRLPLIVVVPTKTAYEAFIAQHGTPSNVALAVAVSDDELAALYNAATMLVHPSRYEGFGYPVVEAMRCGTPVITTTWSSLPEVGGDAAILVDPDDVQGFADAIEAVYADPERRARMHACGLEQAQHFNGEQLGRNTFESYQKALHQPVKAVPPDRPRIALWSSFPPLKCGVGDYTAELLEQLALSADVEVFVDDGYLPAALPLSRYAIQHYTAFERRDRQKPFDVVIYQMGATYFQRFMYDTIQKRPGIVVLHDLIMGLGFYFLYYDDQKTLKKQILAPEGDDIVRQFEHYAALPEPGRREALTRLFDEHYILRWITNSSLAQIVHMNDARAELEARYDNANVHTVDMGVVDPWAGRDARSALPLRAKYGLKRSTFVVGVFGSVDPVKRIETCLQAVSDLREGQPDVMLIVVGNQHDPVYMAKLHDLVDTLDLHDQVRFYGHVPREDFDNLLLTTDVVVNLRFPSRKGMSAILLRAIAAGKPAIISDVPEWRDFPEDFCWRLAPDDAEVSTLAGYLRKLSGDRALRQTLSAQARAYFERRGMLAHMAEQYIRVIEDVTGRSFRSASTRPTGKAMTSMRILGFNKTCEIEDFSDPELSDVIRDVYRHEFAQFPPEYPNGVPDSKQWEIGMSVRALRQFGALRPDARILGVGAGTEVTSFYLTQHAEQVIATDLYLNPGVWGDVAPTLMLSEPEIYAPYPFEQDRLIAQHMDGRLLQYPDNFFDGIFSSGSIEHFGSLAFVANAAYEMGRVLKPGGVLTLATEFKIAGPPNGDGWDSSATILFSRERLIRYIIEASGLELVDDLTTDLSPETMKSKRDLATFLSNTQGRTDWRTKVANYPNLVLTHEGYVFCSVHLTLCKSDKYPVVDNAWAAPSQATREAVAAMNYQVQPAVPSGIGLVAGGSGNVIDAAEAAGAFREVEHQFERWDYIRVYRIQGRLARRLPGPLRSLYQMLLRVRRLGMAWDVQRDLYRAMVNYMKALRAGSSSSGASDAGTQQRLQQMYTEQAMLRDWLEEHERRLRAFEAQADDTPRPARADRAPAENGDQD